MIVLLVIVALIVLLLVIPFGVSARYVDGEASVAARVLCFNIRLFPRAEKPKKVKKAQKPKKEKKPKEKPEKAPKKRPKPSPDELLQLLKLGLEALARFKRKLTVNRFMLHLVVAAEDPFDATVIYGAVNAGLGLVESMRGKAFKARSVDIQTALDYNSTEPRADAELTVTISLGRILAVVFAAGWGFMKLKIRAAKQSAAVKAEEERKENNGPGSDPNGGIPANQHG